MLVPRAVATLIFTTFLLGSGAARAEAPTIEQAWATFGAFELEGYVTINNVTSVDVSLTKVGVPAGARSVLHNREHQELPAGFYIPIHSELFMQPGGVHVAVLNIAPTVGDIVPITIEFAGQGAQTTGLEVVASPDKAPAHYKLH